MERRAFLRLAGVAALASLACTSKSGIANYEDAVRRTWHQGGNKLGNRPAVMQELVRCATLAPSSHNTQCWKFLLEEQSISVLPDLARRCPAVDPDDHHLFVSLGCAAENLILAGLANGLRGEARFEPAAAGRLRISLEPAKAIVSPLFQALPERQCTRTEFDGKPLSNEDLKMLEQAGTGQGVRVLLLTGKAAMEKVLEYVIAGNTTQMHDPAFVQELKAWIRFSREEAVRTGDGLFSGATGNPSVPRWLGSLLFGMLFTPKSENDKYAKQIRSSSGIAIFLSEVEDKAHWVEAGRCYERFALQSAAMGIRNAMINQPVEVPALRPRFAAALGLDNHRPDLVVRFGRGPRMPQSLRRPVLAVLA